MIIIHYFYFFLTKEEINSNNFFGEILCTSLVNTQAIVSDLPEIYM